MHSTMQETPLSLATLLRYGTTVHGTSEVITWTGDGVRTATYAEVGRRSAQLAHGLRALGVTGDDRVATFMWNNQEHLEAYCAVPAMGAVLHPLNIRLFSDQLAFIAEHAQDKVVIVDGSVLPLLAKVLGQIATIEHLVVNGPADLTVLEGTQAEVHAYEDVLAGQPEEFDWVEVDENDAAAMCYTSGTTGHPKGVAYSHRSIYLHSMQVCMADGFGLSQADRILLIVPMFHVLAWGTTYAAMMCGATMIMPDRFLAPEPLADLIETTKPTLAGGVPTIWAGLLAHLDEHPRDLSSIRDAIVGGSAAPRALMEGLDRHGLHLTHAWGMTETSPLGTISRPPAGVEGEERWRYRLTQGRLAASVQARLVGPDGSEMPRDGVAVGELEVRGPWITGSYFRDDDPDKFDDGWLRTGDVGTITPDGFLTLTDRSKDVIKSGGEWISSVELENQLMAHPAVAEASVVGVPDEKWGERPLATVVVRDGATVTVEELREHLAAKVASWQLPERWAFIDEVPKTSVGKFDKKVIRRQYADGALDVRTLP
ncbi:MAG TPA: long-chain fatty acid--CoA ligase [Actinomycetes bacterium]|jgi:fatty-acyl-CoA synthase|nr:long-chain fatty acid--CoA ligase [Actinomycetes bacterium]